MADNQPVVAPQIELFVARELGNSSFLIADPDAGEAVAIDPLRDIGQYLERAGRLQVRLTRSLDTHLHNDFVSGGRELAAEAGAVIEPLADQQEVAVGRWRLRAMLTPGHTPDHLSYLLSDSNGKEVALFSGGALMVGAIARTDLFGPHLAVHLALEAFRTVQVRLRGLPDDVALYPTHGGGSFCASAAPAAPGWGGSSRAAGPWCWPAAAPPSSPRRSASCSASAMTRSSAIWKAASKPGRNAASRCAASRPLRSRTWRPGCSPQSR